MSPSAWLRLHGILVTTMHITDRIEKPVLLSDVKNQLGLYSCIYVHLLKSLKLAHFLVVCVYYCSNND